MKKAVIITLALSAIGCTSSGTYWNHPGATASDFERDKAQCLYEAEAAVQVPNYGYATQLFQALDIAFRRESLAISCMEARGWYRMTKEDVKDY